MSLEQIEWVEGEHAFDRSCVLLMVDGRSEGRAYLEPLEDGFACLHYSLHDEWRGMGFGSMMLDLAFKRWGERHDPEMLLFVDDPRYLGLGGRGFHTDNGRRFADAYRKKRGLKRRKTRHRFYTPNRQQELRV